MSSSRATTYDPPTNDSRLKDDAPAAAASASASTGPTSEGDEHVELYTMPSSTTPSRIRINFVARTNLPTPERDVLYFPSKGWYVLDGRLTTTPEDASWHLRILANDGGWVTSLKLPRGIARWLQDVEGGQSGKEVVVLEERGGWMVEVLIQREE